MAVTTTETQITWSSASSVTVSSATEVDSDAVTLDDAVFRVDVMIYTDNQGTPASGDTAVFRLKGSAGDILGDTGDDYSSSEHAQLLAVLDTYGTNTPGEDPASRMIVDVPIAKKFKIGVTCANAATRNMVVRARIVKYSQ